MGEASSPGLVRTPGARGWLGPVLCLSRDTCRAADWVEQFNPTMVFLLAIHDRRMVRPGAETLKPTDSPALGRGGNSIIAAQLCDSAKPLMDSSPVQAG